MKRAWMGLIGGVMLLAGAVGGAVYGAQGRSTAEAEKKVAALEAQWLEAQKMSDPNLLAPLLAEQFVNISTDSAESNKAETLELVKKAKFVSGEYLEVKVTVFGETAIARGVFHGNGADGAEVLERWTDTWVKTGKGQWQCVASHASPMKKTK